MVRFFTILEGSTACCSCLLTFTRYSPGRAPSPASQVVSAYFPSESVNADAASPSAPVGTKVITAPARGFPCQVTVPVTGYLGGRDEFEQPVRTIPTVTNVDTANLPGRFITRR